MSLAIVRRLFSSEDLEIHDPGAGASPVETLSPEELAEFKDVLDRYARGDMHTRLNLWLYHRDLRETFEVLEQHQ
jgi:hypothetical protein